MSNGVNPNRILWNSANCFKNWNGGTPRLLVCNLCSSSAYSYVKEDSKLNNLFKSGRMLQKKNIFYLHK